MNNLKRAFIKITKKEFIKIFIYGTTIPSLFLNLENSFFGNYATILNLIVSIIFLLLWFSLSLYCGFKNDKSYKKFTLIYWGINIFTFLLARLSSIINFNTMFLIPLAIWYGSPIYGLSYLISRNRSMFDLICTFISFLINFLGYFIGYYIYKFKIKERR